MNKPTKPADPPQGDPDRMVAITRAAGERPTPSDYTDHAAYQQALTDWETKAGIVAGTDGKK